MVYVAFCATFLGPLLLIGFLEYLDYKQNKERGL